MLKSLATFMRILSCSLTKYIYMTDPIKAKIVELMPEIMELKVGCIVAVGDAMLPHTVYGIDEGIVSAYLNKPFPKSMRANDFYDCEFGKDYKGNLEILGSPITLAVVLRVIEKQNAEKITKVLGVLYFGINSAGQFIFHESATVKYTGIVWNLELDSYDQQSDETKAFIGELLGVK